MEYGPRATDIPSAPSPPPAPAPVTVPLPPSIPAPIPASKIPANIARQNSSSSDSGGSIVRDSQRQKQVPVDRKFPREAKIHSFSCELKALLGKKFWVLFLLAYAKVTSVMSNSAALWTIAHQTPLSMGFSRQEYWSELPCPPPGNLPDPGIERVSPEAPTLQGFLTTEPLGKPLCW